jgi:hypothetical protein
MSSRIYPDKGHSVWGAAGPNCPAWDLFDLVVLPISERTRTNCARSRGQRLATTHTGIMPTHPDYTNYSLP